MNDQLTADADAGVLSTPFSLPCGVVLRNRLAKSPMSDSLGNGAGQPTAEQNELYRRWAAGGAALSLIGEVQIDSRYPEKPGNLVLGPEADPERFGRLAAAGSVDGAHIWPQLGHAGALTYAPIHRPVGPSALTLDGLSCDELTATDIERLPRAYAAAAARAVDFGFRGVQIHAGHGFLLSQFLCPLFNVRNDAFGGSIENRSRLLLQIVDQVREAVGPSIAIAVRINSSDQIEGGLSESDSLIVIGLLGERDVDLLDISGGTYFPGAPASSDRTSSGPYFVDFARRAREVTDVPLMVTGGFKTRAEAANAVRIGAADIVGLGRTMALDPSLASTWLGERGGDPVFPRFDSPPEGGITAWFTMRLTAIGQAQDQSFNPTLHEAISEYEARDSERVSVWREAFALDA